MSNIYIQEPPSNGKVLMVTTGGDIDIELWSKETPKACRNFVQLCMEGYYDGTIFHRVVQDFIVQGGDPTGTGEGGESIYGHPFKDEIHSRLRFVRRGLLAMANAGQNDNGSQFFFTLAPAPELNRKHTIFGKVTGNTVFNMLKLADVEVDGDRPVEPYKIVKTEILSNPFDDIEPRCLPKRLMEKESKKKKSQSKATKNFSLLSFGEEAEEDEEETNTVTKEMKGKSKSSHDLTNDPRLSSVPAVDIPEASGSNKRKDSSEESEESDSEMRERIRKKLKKAEPENTDKEKEKPAKATRSEELRREVQQLKKELMEAKKRKEQKSKDEDKTPEPEPENDAVANFKKEQLKYKEHRKKQPKKGAERENQTLAILAKFQSKLDAAREKVEQDGEEKDEESDSWLGHKLEFESSNNKVLDANVNEEDRYEIYDPRNPMNKRRRENSKQSAKDKKR